MRVKISLLVVLMVAVSSQSSFAALNAHLWLAGEIQGDIEGGVTQAGREGSIMVMAYDHITSSTREPDTCMPSRINHLPLQITKEVDIATPLLYEAFANNELITKFTLRFWQLYPDAQQYNFYTIELINARIVGIHQEMLNNRYPENMEHKEREHISFVYETIIRTIEDGGTTSRDAWQSNCGQQIRISDLNFDGLVNLIDLSILADEWLLEAY